MQNSFDELNQRKPPCLCDAPAWALKDGAISLYETFTFIFNECTDNSKFPFTLKQTLVTPEYKKDDLEQQKFIHLF